MDDLKKTKIYFNRTIEYKWLRNRVAEAKPVTIYMTNGFQMKGVIVAEDDIVVEFREEPKAGQNVSDYNDQSSIIIYKANISTIK